MKYLVAIDGSENAKTAFFTVLKLMQMDRDYLYLVTVVEDPTQSIYAHVFGGESLQKALDNVVTSSKNMLSSYAAVAKEYKANVELLLSISNHVGEALCKIVEDKQIDYLVMGRRGLGTLKRMFVGSNSKYCTEHAKCNILIVKKDWLNSEEEKALNDLLAKASLTETKPEPKEELAKQQQVFPVEVIKTAS